MSFYSVLFTSRAFLTLFGLFLCVSDVQSMRTLKNVAVKRGGSVTIPCLYDRQYKSNLKYWCRGYFWFDCKVIAYANANGRTSAMEYQTENMFTVDLNPDGIRSGWYWCAAEIGGSWTLDDRDYLYLTVRQDPDLSVKESRVRGEEGGGVTVVCLYSAAYRNHDKKWCRFKNQTCNSVGSETSQNSSAAVVVNDDGKSSFTVEMSGLKRSDAGWYWCGAGDLQVPVHVSVGASAPALRKPAVSGRFQTIDFCIAHD